MPTTKARTTNGRKTKAKSRKSAARYLCSSPPAPERPLSGVTRGRTRLIRENEKKWVNGTILHYYFFKSPRRWSTSDAERQVVRKAFKKWMDLGIGLEFQEVSNASDAEIRIGFQRGDGAWSYLGRDVLDYGTAERTMNFGWDIRSSAEFDTALHEIGHTLGFPHEHQNPFAGIEWNDEQVYADLSGPPNNWDRETTQWNILRKLRANDLRGSDWDPDSVMHYQIDSGWINKPTKYKTGLMPAGGLSDRDKEWALKFYPMLKPSDYRVLRPFEFERLHIEPGEQVDLVAKPDTTRTYNISTFGKSDTVMVLFEEVDGELKYRSADDDSGTDANARLRVKLYKGRRYVLRLRLYYQERAGDFGVMMW